jgi:phosphoglycerate dehydrogenase-like enzyme
VITLPKSIQTDAVIDQSWFASMPSDLVLINVSRAGVVDEASLYHTLKISRIGGATLDDEKRPAALDQKGSRVVWNRLAKRY